MPARELRRLLKELPAAIGLAVPGTPLGSPGMDGADFGGRRDPYQVLLVTADGGSRVHASYPLLESLPMKNPMIALALTALLAGAALAQTASVDRAAHPPAASAATASDLTVAEVRRVDREGGKVTLKHEPIKNLDMPGMTMVFQVRDRSTLDTLKSGDKVRFRAIEEAGKYIVTEIRAHE